MLLLAIYNDSENNKFTQLFKLYHRTLLAYAESILHSYESAEEAVEETYIRVLKNLDKIEDINSAQARNFLLKITQRICLNILTKDKHYIG